MGKLQINLITTVLTRCKDFSRDTNTFGTTQKNEYKTKKLNERIIRIKKLMENKTLLRTPTIKILRPSRQKSNIHEVIEQWNIKR